jgi:hypothetical protein
MRFFIPHTSKAEAEGAYSDIVASLKSQFRLPIHERRILSLSYTNSKKRWHAKVGQLEQQEQRYEILAIFESKSFIIFTRSTSGDPGPIILVDKDEVTAVEDFEQPGAKAPLNLKERAI